MGRKINRDPAVQELLDKQEIYELLARYCRSMDRCDEELARSVYHPDAMDYHGFFNGKASEYCSFAIAVNKMMKKCVHTITHWLIEVEGDVAFGESYWQAFGRTEKDGKDHEVYAKGRYLDRFERRNGVWKIAKRQCVYDSNQTCVSTEDPNFGFDNPDLVWGRPGRDDLVYRLRSDEKEPASGSSRWEG